ncbi:MAG TPA: DNA mismatch repair endonuclease MutL [Lachnospiraceae bacterium]|nr:DNA mismatch repair endonuclease MutL [Lachnospiraceae bacterium]
MAQIAVLDQETIDQIAAGEVVERPASVVKELVENAIDADSTAVTVEVKQGGITFIRITDNGCGIGKEQLSLAFLRHATSKLKKMQDLWAIGSLGFRGEALSSIAAVAQVEMITKQREDLTGVRYCIDGGREQSCDEVGAPDGTTILVRNLFYNTPARAKFLKTPATEGNYITGYMEQLALSHPQISFKYILNGQLRFQTAGNGKLKEIIYQIYGRDITEELVEIGCRKEGMDIHGYIGKPVVSRGNRNFENYYVNGRYVKDRILMKAIEESYRGFLMQHQYPFTCLFLELDGGKVDVNVHPSKMEVRFSDQENIYQSVKQVLTDALRGAVLVPKVQLEKESKSARSKPSEAQMPEPFEEKRREEYLHRLENESKKQEASNTAGETKPTFSAFRENTENYHIKKPVPQQQSSNDGGKVQQISLFDADEHFPFAGKDRAAYRIIGQLFDTYWLIECGDELYIIDQHAAHEKVLYEQMIKSHKRREIFSQMVSPPIVIQPSMQERQLLETHIELFAEYGFEVEEFGLDAYCIRSVPHNLYGIATDRLFMELLSECSGSLEKNDSRELIGEKIATMACKAAVKGNNRMSVPEMQRLIDELLTLDNPYQCPHGRPTIIKMSKTELEKKFRRIV